MDGEEVLCLLRRREGPWVEAVEGEEDGRDDPGGEDEGRGPPGEPEEDAPSAPRDVPSLTDGVEVEEPERGDAVVVDVRLRRRRRRRCLFGRGDGHALAAEEPLQLLVLVHAFPGSASHQPAPISATAPAHVVDAPPSRALERRRVRPGGRATRSRGARGRDAHRGDDRCHHAPSIEPRASRGVATPRMYTSRCETTTWRGLPFDFTELYPVDSPTRHRAASGSRSRRVDSNPR